MAEVREYVAVDGVRLAISRFRTRRGAPPPVIVEALPKRTDDLTAIERKPDGSSTKGRDALTRVDRRGTGSPGIATDESAPQERRDLVGLIAGARAQPWSTGRVGGYGTRSVHTSRLVAAQRRPERGGVGAISSSDARSR